ncbi:MAG: hypothetical protein ABS882_04760 [Lysinibacillus sp.]
MAKVVDKELIHEYIICELVIKTLEIDIVRIESLKSKMVLEKIYNKALDMARTNMKGILDNMRRTGLKLLVVKKDDEFFSTYTVTQYGLTIDITYSHHALRNHTMNEIEKLINVKNS